MIKLTNTLSGKKEELVPLRAGEIKMYVCGPTVYDDIHIGNARSAVNFDVIRKYLVSTGLKVQYVMNITDIDDKIIKKALEEKKDYSEIAQTYSEAYREVMEKLGVEKPDLQPKATDSIPGMITLIAGLIEKKHAYAVPSTDLGQDVLYDSATFAAYGKLSGKNLEEILEGARVDKDERKKSPTDFVLWKASKPGEPQWDSPWGKGRPGWHIECSAMVRQHLGDSIDIHGGGIDLIFPHHENEIAQCEAFTEKPYVKYWLHNGFIEISGQKMSKSLGNIWKAKDALAEFKPAVLRYFFLTAHYRSGLNYDRPILEAAGRGLEEFNMTFQRIEEALNRPDEGMVGNLLELRLALDEVDEKFKDAMEDDFNTPKAMAALFELARMVRQVLSQPGASHPGTKNLLGAAGEKLAELGGLLGIVSKEEKVLPSRVEELKQERIRFKNEKQYEEADKIRIRIGTSGYRFEDIKGGTSAVFPEQNLSFLNNADLYVKNGWIEPSGAPSIYLFTMEGIEKAKEGQMRDDMYPQYIEWAKQKGYFE